METLTLEDVIDVNATFEPATLRAVKALARTKPWQGDFDTRYQNIHACFIAMRDGYGIAEWDLVHVGSRGGCSGESHLDVKRKRIVLTGRLSVVTMLHLFAKVRRMISRADEPLRDADHFKAIRWSVNLFKRTFPISYSRCRLVGGLLVNDGRRDD